MRPLIPADFAQSGCWRLVDNTRAVGSWAAGIHAMAENGSTDITSTMACIPSGVFVLTACHDDARTGVLATWVQQCSIDPPMVMVSLPKGLPVEPLIRDSRHFALCQISEDDRFLQRKFAAVPAPGEDPFVAIFTTTAPSGSPVVGRAMTYLDCELVRHIDIESDHALYIGQVCSGQVLNNGCRPAIILDEHPAHSNGQQNGAAPSAEEIDDQ